MLSLPDAELLRRDPALPGLSLLLDPERFTARLRESATEEAPGLLRPAYVRYKPGTSCLVEYRKDTSGEPALYAVARRPNAVDKLNKARRRSTTGEVPGMGTTVLDDGAIEVSWFPSDASLPALARLTEAETRAGLLRERFPDLPGLRESTLTTLAYKPERRYVARLAGTAGEAAVLRLYTEQGFQAAREPARTFRSAGPLRVPKRLGRSVRHRMLLVEWLPGQPLREVIVNPAAGMEVVSLVGAAVAELHAQPAPRLRVLPREKEVASVGAAAEAVAMLCPHLVSTVRELAQRLATRISDSPPMSTAIHGDLYAEQLLVSGNEVAVLDLDRARLGDPAADLGLFLAHLEREVLGGALARHRADDIREAFLYGYGTSAGRSVPERIPTYIALGLLSLAVEPFRRRAPEWPDRIAALVDRAVRVAEC